MDVYTVSTLVLILVGSTPTSSFFTFAANENDLCDTPKFQRGTCIPVKQCAELYAILLRPRPLPPDMVEFLRVSQCGFENRQPLVCCPTATKAPTTTTTTRPPTRKPPTPPTSINSVQDVSRHRNIGLINPDLCGQSSDIRIVGGNKTSIFEFPWMTLLAYRTRTGLDFKCGGSLINDRWVLTAAHCIPTSKDKKLVSVRVGEHDTSKEKDCENVAGTQVCAPPPQDIDVERTIVHPQYSTTKLINDIALVRLSRPAQIKETVRPICLPVGLRDQTNKFEGKKLVVAGWGATETGIRASPDLLKVNLPIVPVPQCNTIYGSKYEVSPNQLCAGGSNLKQDSCNGDSGGPIKTFGQIRGEPSMIQYGIVSYGPRQCGTEGLPGVYTRVGHYMDWIVNELYA